MARTRRLKDISAGARPILPLIPGAELSHVRFAADIYGLEEQLGENIAIIGGGQVGCETAIHLASKGKTVFVIEEKDTLLQESMKELPDESFVTDFYMYHQHDMKQKDMLHAKKTDAIQVFLRSRCSKITENAVEIKNPDGVLSLSADTVLIAAGFCADTSLQEAFKDTAREVLFIGDFLHAGNLRDASSSAYYASLRL